MQVFSRVSGYKLLLLLTLLLLLPAQSHAKVLVGVVMTGTIPYYEDMHRAFADELMQKLPPGEEVQYIVQRPFPDPIAWSNAARKLIALDVDLIVCYGGAATHAVLFEKSRIPVVYAGVYGPEEADVKGPNVTGSGYQIPLSSLLRYFKRIREIRKLRVLYSSTEGESVRQMTELAELTEQQNIEMIRVDIRSHDDLKKLKGFGRDDGVYVTGSALAHVWLIDILDVLKEKGVPAVGIFPDPGEEGMLITLFHPPDQQGEAAAGLASRIIRGEEAGTIAPVLLRNTELVFNLVEAKAIGITFPIQLIIEATRVIK